MTGFGAVSGDDRRQQILLGNTVNRLMLAVPTPQHSAGLAAVAQRKLWLAKPNDMVITPRSIEPEFYDYVASVMERNPKSINVFSPNCAEVIPLAEALLENDYGDRFGLYAHENGAVLNAYALDSTTWRLANEFNLELLGYTSLPPLMLIEQISSLNLKSKFREVALNLNLRTPPGMVCAGAGEVLRAVLELGRQYSGLIIKLDRSSNGYGSLILRHDAADLERLLQVHLQNHKHQGDIYVVEAFLSFNSSPSVELLVNDQGVSPLYICDQRFHGDSFSGVVSPPCFLTQETTRELVDAGLRFGDYLWKIGYRGVFDLDAGLTRDGELFMTEANVRRTAGTCLYELVRDLTTRDRTSSPIWIYDSQSLCTPAGVNEVLEALVSSGLAYSASRGQGALLPAFTLPTDGKFRYLLIADDWNEAQFLESRLGELFGFSVSGSQMFVGSLT